MNVFVPYVVAGVMCVLVIVVYGWHKYYETQKQKRYKEAVTQKENDLKVVKEDLERARQLLNKVSERNSRESFTELVVSQMEQGVICIDSQYVVRFINAYAAQVLDFSAAAGVPYIQILHLRAFGDKDDQSMFAEALQGKVVLLPEGTTLVSGRGTFPISGKIVPIASGIAALIFVDNTMQLSWVKEQQAFFSAAAHELRTPLTVIRLTIALLLERFDSMSKEKILEHLRRADETAGHLVKLVNDFLNISRIDQGRLEIKNEMVNIVGLVDEVIVELGLLAKEKKLYLHHEPISADLANVMGDKVRIKEILTNLISNCIKYTHQGGVTISHQAQEALLVTKVADTGIGIPPESQGLLFKRFVQVGEARRQTTAKSTGLGLYISKKISQLMHGDVVLEHSEPGVGSTFALLLPSH